MKFFILGASGMAGHALTFYLREKGHEVAAHSRQRMRYITHTFDVYNARALVSALRGGYSAVVNCVGLLNAEAESHPADAVYLNSYLPHFLAGQLAGSGTRLIHLSTDCVFSGSRGRYTENDIPDARTRYALTKALGEVTGEGCLTLRTSIVGPDIDPNGTGLFSWFARQTGQVQGYSRAIWSGVTNVELAKAVEEAAQAGLSGLYHLTSSSPISKLFLLRLFGNCLGGGAELVPETNFFADKSLRCTRTDFNYSVPSYEVMAEEMAEWIDGHPMLYSHLKRSQ